LAGLALFLIAVLLISNASNIAHIGATLFGARDVSTLNNAVPTATTETGSDGSGGLSSTFQIGRIYNYSATIGHSKTTSLTNDNVTVTLNSLALSDSDNTAQIVVSFHDYDSQKGAHFLFVARSNIYLFDDLGNRYQAESATPDEVLIDPGQGGTVLVKFPMIRSSAKYLQLYFNTDKNALITPCVILQPSETTSAC
jgi:hypothetical protein